MSLKTQMLQSPELSLGAHQANRHAHTSHSQQVNILSQLMETQVPPAKECRLG